MMHNTMHRPTRSANSLHDITNHRYVSKPGNKRALLDKTDVLVIAKQKRDQIQVEKTTQSLKVSIRSLDRELDKLQNRYIPDIVYNMSKRESMLRSTNSNCKHNIQKIKQCEETIQSSDASLQIECETMTRRFEEQLDKIRLEHEQEMNSLKLAKEEEIKALEKIPPKEELLKDIQSLNDQLKDLDDQLNRLKLSNDLIVTQYDEKLDSEFGVLRTSKTNTLRDIEKKGSEGEAHLTELKTEIENTQYSITMTKEENACTIEQCDILQESINKIEKSSVLPEKKLKLLCERFTEVKQEHDVLAEVKKLDEEEYSLRVQKLNNDIEKKLLLQNSIDEVKGNARIFCLTDLGINNNINNSTCPFKVNSTTNVMTDLALDDPKDYKMSRFISCRPNDSKTELFNNLKVYSDMCLKSSQNFNITSISPHPIENLHYDTLSFIAKEYLDTYEIQYQVISLYDEKFSKESPFTIREDKSIILDRTPLFLNNHIPKETSDDINELTQVKILKVQFKEKNSTNDFVDFYSVAIENVKSMNLFYRFLSKEQAWRDNQIGLILLKLLNYTKSCFVFNVHETSTPDENRLSLKISEHVQKIRNPPKNA